MCIRDSPGGVEDGGDQIGEARIGQLQRGHIDGDVEASLVQPGRLTTDGPGGGLTTEMCIRDSVYPFDFADPDVLVVRGTYYAYGTNSTAGNIQIMESSDLANWRKAGDALPTLASWASPGACLLYTSRCV